MPPSETLKTPIAIGIVADTHRHSRGSRYLPTALLDGLDGVDLIFHAGDVCAAWVLDALREVAPVRAVRGNNEEPDLEMSLPDQIRFTAGSRTIALLHGHQSPRGESAREFVRRTLAGEVDCAVYGHSHLPKIETLDGLLMVNPGSPTQRRFAPWHSYAMMNVTEDIDVKLVQLES